MKRLQKFFANAGTYGILKSMLVLFIMASALRKDLSSGLWVVTVPLLLGVFLLGFAVRNCLVEYHSVTPIVMNVIAVLAVVVLLAVGRIDEDKCVACRVAIAAFVGTYMSAYFWFMSDERIEVG